MDVIKKDDLKKNVVNHPYDSNPDYFAKVNMFYYSEDNKFAVGYWEAPVGWFNATIKGFNELDLIIEGEIEAVSEDKAKTVIVKKGDIFTIEDGDRFLWKVNQPTKAMFFIYPLTPDLKDFFDSLIM